MIPRLAELTQKQTLTHDEAVEKRDVFESIYKLLCKYAQYKNYEFHIYDKEYVDNEVLWKTFEYSFETYIKNSSDTFYAIFDNNYTMNKKPEIQERYFELISGDEVATLKNTLFNYMEKIGAEHNVKKEILKKEIYNRMKYPSYTKAKKFAIKIGCTQDEIDELTDIFNNRYINHFDYKSCYDEEESAQSQAEVEASLTKDIGEQIDNWSKFPIFNEILEITHKEACKKGGMSAKYMSGYWTIQLIEERIGNKQAKIWEMYIMLLFFMEYSHYFDKHGKLMDLMANEFNIKRRAWNNHYSETFNDICRYIYKLKILKV